MVPKLFSIFVHLPNSAAMPGCEFDNHLFKTRSSLLNDQPSARVDKKTDHGKKPEINQIFYCILDYVIFYISLDIISYF